MLNKKSQTGIVIFIVIIIILLIIGIVLFIVFQKGYIKVKNNEKNITYINLYFQTKDSETNLPVISNYMIFNSTGLSHLLTIDSSRLISQGTTISNETREVNLTGYSHAMICWSDDYYLRKAIKEFNNYDIQNLKATFSCNMDKIEKNLNIERKGKLLDQEFSTIRLNISSKDVYQNLQICTSWTSGFISIVLQDNLVTCDYGSWRNYTDFNETTNKPNYLPVGNYLCGNLTDGMIQNCTSVYGDKCEPISIKEPLRFSKKVDRCYNTGKTLNDNSIELTFVIKKGEFTTSNDYIQFYIFDMDRRYNRESNDFTWTSETNSIDIASPDILLKLNYGDE